MKKKIVWMISMAIMVLSGISVSAAEYKNGTFSLNYDKDRFLIEDVGGDGLLVTAVDMPDEGEGHNTVLGCLSEEHSEYHNLGVLSETEKKAFQGTLAQQICTGLFEVDEGVSIVSDGYQYEEGKCEYSMILSDGTECYTMIYNYGEKIHYSVCRLCPYTDSLNDEYRDIYRSIRLSAPDVNNSEEESVEEPEVTCDFRNTVWGMSKEEVKELEGEPILEDEEDALYQGTAAGKPVDILYQFKQDKLVSGAYFFTDEHDEKILYYEDYQYLVDAYSEKYGEPLKVEEEWKDDLYRDNPDELGRAIAVGHVSFAAVWETDTTSIDIRLWGDDYKITLLVLYEDKNCKQKVNTDGI